MQTPPPTESRTQRRTAEMRRHIVDVAARLLASQGIERLTADAVAQEADVALQTVYNRVGGKPALIAAVTELAVAENHRYIDEAYAQPGLPMERLDRAARAYAEFAFQHPHLFWLLASPPDDEATLRMVELHGIQNGKAIEAYREGIAQGSLRADLSPEDAVTVLWAMINGVLMLALRPGAHQLPEAQRAQMVEVAAGILHRGLAAGTAPRD